MKLEDAASAVLQVAPSCSAHFTYRCGRSHLAIGHLEPMMDMCISYDDFTASPQLHTMSSPSASEGEGSSLLTNSCLRSMSAQFIDFGKMSHVPCKMAKPNVCIELGVPGAASNP